MCFNTGCRLSKCPFEEYPARKRKTVKRIGSIRYALERGRNCDFCLSDPHQKALCDSVQRLAAALTVPLANGPSNAATRSRSRPDSIAPNAAGVRRSHQKRILESYQGARPGDVGRGRAGESGPVSLPFRVGICPATKQLSFWPPILTSGHV
jgi:hypothetical protein